MQIGGEEAIDLLRITRRNALTLGCAALASHTSGQQKRTTQAGTLLLRARSRSAEPSDSGNVRVREEALRWRTSETAIIICDMWNNHYCQNTVRRVAAIARRMNDVITKARSLGVTIIHAPSATMKFYAGTPQRLRLMEAPTVTPPVLIGTCPLDRSKEGPLPIDDSPEPCDDEVVTERGPRRQNELLDIAPEDGISDNGAEIYSYLGQRQIRNVVLMGVATNMCVLGRPFGIRQQVRLSMNVALARDLTDAMYNPKQRPWVSHERGTELVVEHIERYWCPSILSADLARLAPEPESARQKRPVPGGSR